jgi:uncharacterized protein YkwD
MLAKLAICAWSVYLGAGSQEAFRVSDLADLKTRMEAAQEVLAQAWAEAGKARADKLDGTEPAEESGKVRLVAVEKSVVEATNAHRAEYGLPPLEIDDDLMKTARDHCAWMTNTETMRHTNLPVAENIAMGQESPNHVLQTWMGSSGHRANILNGAFRRIGVAAYQTPRGVIFWCQQFQYK